jgi:hypothetical protein
MASDELEKYEVLQEIGKGKQHSVTVQVASDLFSRSGGKPTNKSCAGKNWITEECRSEKNSNSCPKLMR